MRSGSVAGEVRRKPEIKSVRICSRWGSLNTSWQRPGYRRRVLSAEDTASCTITDPASGQIRSSVPCKTSSGTDSRGRAPGRRCVTASISAPVRALILPRYTKVRPLAPPQQAVVVASVPAIAVKSLDGDRAIVLVFLDQQAHQGGEGNPLRATGRLSITAQRVDGRWKIADTESF